VSAVIQQVAAGDWNFAFARWPHELALRHRALLVHASSGDWLLVADREPEPMLMQVVAHRLREPLRWEPCSTEQLEAWLAMGDDGFRALDAVNTEAESRPDDLRPAAHELAVLHLAKGASPAVRLLDALLYDALQDGASDVHIECIPGGAEVRMRIDGVMLPVRRITPAELTEQIVSRLKVMAELDIGERRLPQDGRFQARMQGRDVDFRLSTMPSAHGEDAVVRVLDRAAIEREAGALSLSTLGFDGTMRAAIVDLARAPHGMLLVTGPTGSGKTTTLYAAIAEIRDGRDKIITIEDPVEYQLQGVVQIPVNEKKGLSFARGLRSILRHDPDRIMVGEIRDAETAQIAVQAALTGHLVLSTVHANNAFDVVGRFMHMGLDLYNVMSALNAVLAQRLVRKVCARCAEPVEAPPAASSLLQAHAAGALSLRHGKGCSHCHGTGYRGRLALAELLRLDDGLRDLIAARAPMSEIKQAARARGMAPLRHAALAAVARGDTTLEEADRVTSD
jgi:general secretion pathway protein E